MLKDFLGIIDALMLAFGQSLSNDLLHWGRHISGAKWWQQQPSDLLWQLVVAKCLLELIQKALKSLVTPAVMAPLVPFCSIFG